jgi:hypothetical protein
VSRISDEGEALSITNFTALGAAAPGPKFGLLDYINSNMSMTVGRAGPGYRRACSA